jgi:hypothetical protein
MSAMMTYEAVIGCFSEAIRLRGIPPSSRRRVPEGLLRLAKGPKIRFIEMQSGNGESGYFGTPPILPVS